MNTSNTHQRKLEIDGTYNVRDLGGYETNDHRATRWGQLFRADKLVRVTEDGLNAIHHLGIKTIIDLRYTPEIEVEPNVYSNSRDVNYLHLPLYELSGDAALPRVPDDLADLYEMILDYRQQRIAEIISVLMTESNQPAIFHCTAGKDRTGIIAALLLGAAGVSDADVINDYALSEQYLHVLFDELREQARQNGYDSDWYNRLLICEPATMTTTLGHIQRCYGGIVPYLLRVGITEIQIASFRRAFLTQQPSTDAP
jgi:protein-tyrosine phosphatase